MIKEQSPSILNSQEGHEPSPELHAVVARFIGWSERLLASKGWSATIPLFHYTSVANLEKILQSRQIWMMRIQAQPKDPEELRFGLRLLAEIVETNAKEATESPLHSDFFRRLRMFDETSFSKYYDCHVACFSAHGEDFDLWENFGGGGTGVALEIDPSFFAIRPADDGEPNWVVQPVTYGAEQPLHGMRKIIQVATIALGEVAPLIKSNADYAFVMENFLAQVALAHLVPMCFLAKSGDFVPETEIRILSPSYHPPEAQREHHRAAHFNPSIYLRRVLVGEKSDRAEVERVLNAAGLNPEMIKVAAYSSGLKIRELATDATATPER